MSNSEKEEIQNSNLQIESSDDVKNPVVKSSTNNVLVDSVTLSNLALFEDFNKQAGFVSIADMEKKESEIDISLVTQKKNHLKRIKTRIGNYNYWYKIKLLTILMIFFKHVYTKIKLVGGRRAEFVKLKPLALGDANNLHGGGGSRKTIKSE